MARYTSVSSLPDRTVTRDHKVIVQTDGGTGLVTLEDAVSAVGSVTSIIDDDSPVNVDGGAVTRTIKGKFGDFLSVRDFGAVGDGVTNDKPAVQAAVNTGRPVFFPPGTYYFGSAVVVPNNTSLILRGESPNAVRIIGAVGIEAFKTDRFTQPYAFVKSVDVEGIWFDGQVQRNTFPYATGSVQQGLLMSMDMVANPNDRTARCRVRNCWFTNMANLPYLFDHFEDVLITETRAIRTKDPGFRFCNKVIFRSNVTEYGADNGVSLSRGCRNIVCSDNVFKDCEAYGLWINGFNVNYGAQGRTALITGSTYTAGSAVTLTTNNNLFGSSDVGSLYTIFDGVGTSAPSGVIRINQVVSRTVVNATVAVDIPAGIQNSVSTNWYLGPANAPFSFTAQNNLIIGGYTGGIALQLAPKRGRMSGNTILRSGYIADSEKQTTGTIAAGSTSLTLADATNFAVSDIVLVDPKGSLQDYFMARVSGKAGNVLTLDRAAPQTMAGDPVALIHYHPNAGYPILMTGQNIGIKQYSENVHITENLIDEYGRFGAVLSGSAGSCKNVRFEGNTFTQSQGLGLTTRIAVVINEAVGMPVSMVVVRNNISEDTGYFLTGSQHGATRRSLYIKDNIAPNSAAPYRILDADDADADVTHIYGPEYVDASGATVAANLKGTDFRIGVMTGTDLSVAQSYLSLGPVSGGFTVSSFTNDVPGLGHPIFVVRNSSPTWPITITYGASTIRTKTGTDYSISPYGSAMFVFIGSGLVQQIA